jgi:hypothetical protein
MSEKDVYSPSTDTVFFLLQESLIQFHFFISITMEEYFFSFLSKIEKNRNIFSISNFIHSYE